MFQFGNYLGYYGYRLNEQGQDPRIACLKPEWLDGKEVLDIGCNSGVFTLQMGTLPLDATSQLCQPVRFSLSFQS